MRDQLNAGATSEKTQTWKTIHTIHALIHFNKENIQSVYKVPVYFWEIINFRVMLVYIELRVHQSLEIKLILYYYYYYYSFIDYLTFNLSLIDAFTWLTPPLQSHDLSGERINSGSHTYFWPHKNKEGLPGWGISSMPRPSPSQHEHERRYRPFTHPLILTRRL